MAGSATNFPKRLTRGTAPTIQCRAERVMHHSAQFLQHNVESGRRPDWPFEAPFTSHLRAQQVCTHRTGRSNISPIINIFQSPHNTPPATIQPVGQQHPPSPSTTLQQVPSTLHLHSTFRTPTEPKPSDPNTHHPTPTTPPSCSPE